MSEVSQKSKTQNIESQRLVEDEKRIKNWKRWGPYLSERQWGTVREDYSADGSCWSYFSHDHARSRVYRWGEDGLLGITDRECRLCFGLALWNGKDPILKERLFGLTGPEGNHGEDVKECYYYLDSTPTHSYMKALYKYPHNEFPYAKLLEESKKRSKKDPEYELIDTGIFDQNQYFDVFVEYAKNSPDDILIKIKIINHASNAASIHLLPTLWFRNSWSWGREGEAFTAKPNIKLDAHDRFLAEHATLGKFILEADQLQNSNLVRRLFTDNETNLNRLFAAHNDKPFVKDSFHDFVVNNQEAVVNPQNFGTKAAFYYKLDFTAGQEISLNFRLYPESEKQAQSFGQDFEKIFSERKSEADLFYQATLPETATKEDHNVSRQAYAGLLWSKQFYYYSVKEWLEGDPSQPKPASSRKNVRNSEWMHLYNRDIISMPDKWEYPWYAAWDSAFHAIPFCQVDPDFAKQQLILFLREWYMHPNGQIPAYEFAFGDVNPPVHAWAAWRIYKMTAAKGQRDRVFLARVFQKLLLNFNWWVNRKDIEGKNLFSGGFLGLDNIGVFDRSAPLPTGGHLEQADGTAWMAFYCLTMLSIALELASEDPAYEDLASKFFEHFITIADAINTLGGTGLWDTQDGFYYDQLHLDSQMIPLRVRSMVGIIPIFAIESFEENILNGLPGFKKRMNWFISHRQDLAKHISYLDCNGSNGGGRRLLAVPSRERLEKVLRYVLDENEFLSDYGIRSLSRIHKETPYIFKANGQEYKVEYSPGESNTTLFGGNSNWRGPVWFPLNYLLIEALERYHHFYGDSFKVECPVGSGKMLNLRQVAREISKRLSNLFLPDQNFQRACHGTDSRYANDPAWKDLVLFYEYFHGDSGRGLGASHQTGWTALVTRSLKKIAKHRK